MECFRCGQEGHISRECTLPTAPPPKVFGTWAEHLATIDGYVQQWIDGEIGLMEKRRKIAGENMRFYGEACPRRLIETG